MFSRPKFSNITHPLLTTATNPIIAGMAKSVAIPWKLIVAFGGIVNGIYAINARSELLALTTHGIILMFSKPIKSQPRQRGSLLSQQQSELKL